MANVTALAETVAALQETIATLETTIEEHTTTMSGMDTNLTNWYDRQMLLSLDPHLMSRILSGQIPSDSSSSRNVIACSNWP